MRACFSPPFEPLPRCRRYRRRDLERRSLLLLLFLPPPLLLHATDDALAPQQRSL
jgi:hypothetical protein